MAGTDVRRHAIQALICFTSEPLAQPVKKTVEEIPRSFFCFLSVRSGFVRLSLMKRLLLLALLILVSQNAFSAEIESSGPLRKLQRGFVNIALCPMDITTELAKEKSENSDLMLPSYVSGAFRGVAFAGGRALAGVYDIVTFPIPFPKEYAPLVQPEFPWDHLKTSPTVQNK